MNAIFSCKLFRACDHKEKILAAMQDPINQELVLQLDEYLKNPPATEIKKPKLVDRDEQLSADDSAKQPQVPKQSRPPRSASHAPAESSDPHRLSKMLEDAETSDTSSDPDLDADLDTDTPETVDDESVEGVVDIDETPVNTTKDVDFVGCTEQILEEGQHSEDIRSVRRRGSELWIYCKDHVNLNHIMDDIIDDVRSVCGDQLSFNRLARTDNAIVFTEEVAS